MKASEVLKKLSSGELIPLLRGIYSENIDNQLLRYKEAIQSFMDYYGDQDIMIFSVPGKCEIGGIIPTTSMDVFLHPLFN